MIVMTYPATSSTSTTSERIAIAERRMYDAEFALHAARQTNVDTWIVAAYDKLHTAITEHTAAIQTAPVAALATAA